ncbi:MAG: class I SAM-dependent methyltransferase [Treponema sp.]|nr:class I SAM-dependent methyltransferase [Treponema sp.]
MFWDKISGVYDLFETLYNRKVYLGTGKKVAEYIDPQDEVLECACGTGGISVHIAKKCKRLVATDFSDGMLRQASKKCRNLKNASFQKADITKLDFADASFDKVVAGNVIHLLPEPEKALAELKRVAKPGATIVIPTYINMSKGAKTFVIKLIEALGASFERQFDFDSYKQFFADMGCSNVEYEIVQGRMPCALAIIKN